MTHRKLPPISPGEFLLQEFLKPRKLSRHRLAREIDVAYGCINEIVRGQRAISSEVAARLARYFGLSKRFWLNLQNRYDRAVAEDEWEDAAMIAAIKAGEKTKSVSRDEIFKLLEGKK